MKKTIFVSPTVIKNSPIDFKRSFLILLQLINHNDVAVILPKNIGEDQGWYVEVLQNFEQCCDVIDFKSNLKDNAFTTRSTEFILVKRCNELAHYEGYITLLDYSMNDFESHTLYTFLPFHIVGRKYLSIIATMGFHYDCLNIWVDNYLANFHSNTYPIDINERVACNLLKDEAVDVVFPNMSEFLNSVSTLNNSKSGITM